MPDDFQKFTDEPGGKYRLVYELHDRYFFACVEADELSPDIINEYQQKIADEIGIRKFGRVMIKRDVPMAGTPAELCGIIYKVRGWDLRDIKYAFVDANAENINAYNLGLLYARNRGMDVTVWADIPAAEKWLLS